MDALENLHMYVNKRNGKLIEEEAGIEDNLFFKVFGKHRSSYSCAQTNIRNDQSLLMQYRVNS
jgi:hypothetical protein